MRKLNFISQGMRSIVASLPVAAILQVPNFCVGNFDAETNQDGPEKYYNYANAVEFSDRVVLLPGPRKHHSMMEINENFDVKFIPLPEELQSLRSVASFQGKVVVRPFGAHNRSVYIFTEILNWEILTGAELITGESSNCDIHESIGHNNELYLSAIDFNPSPHRNYLVKFENPDSEPEVVYEWEGRKASLANLNGDLILIHENLDFIIRFTDAGLEKFIPKIKLSEVEYDYKTHWLGPVVSSAFSAGDWLIINPSGTTYPLPSFVWATNDLQNLCELVIPEGRPTHYFKSENGRGFETLTHDATFPRLLNQRFYTVNNCELNKIGSRKSFDRGIVTQFELKGNKYLHVGGKIYQYQSGKLKLIHRLP